MNEKIKTLEFTFDEEMIEIALEANGYKIFWHPNNWVHKSNWKNPDRAGSSKKQAFEELLFHSNLIPRNVDKCWSEE
jgi:hypothetical protein